MSRNILVYVLSGALILFALLNMSFKKSYRYVKYQQYLALKNKDVSFVNKYYDFDKIVDGIILVVYGNNPNFDKEVMKNNLIHEMESIYINGNSYFNNFSNLKLYICSFLNKDIEGKPLTVKVEDKNTVSITSQVSSEDNFLVKDVFQRDNKQWKIVGMYRIPKN